jgi:photosystem II stability/assembly factor-like uncharacterized protein
MGVMLLIGTAKGMFILESDAKRSKWSRRGPYHKGWMTYGLFADKRHKDPVLYAGVSSFIFGTHIQRSADGGETWAAVENGPSFTEESGRKLEHIWGFAAGPKPKALYCGVSQAALFESKDDGLTWSMVESLENHPTRSEWGPGAGGLCLHTLIPDAKNPQRMFVGISAVGCFRTDDGGASWNPKNRGVSVLELDEGPKYAGEVNRCLHKMVQDPEHPERLYQQNHLGVFRSTDAGDNWERCEEGLPARFGFPIAMHPRDHATLYLIPQESDQVRMFPEGKPAVYSSTNAGDSWHPIGPTDGGNFAGVLRDGLSVDSLDPAGIYFGTSSGQLFGSADEGKNWKQLPGQYPRILNVKAITT